MYTNLSDCQSKQRRNHVLNKNEDCYMPFQKPSPLSQGNSVFRGSRSEHSEKLFVFASLSGFCLTFSLSQYHLFVTYSTKVILFFDKQYYTLLSGMAVCCPRQTKMSLTVGISTKTKLRNELQIRFPFSIF